MVQVDTLIDEQLIETAKNISGIIDNKKVLEQALLFFIQSFQSSMQNKPSLMGQLRNIKIQAPTDFANNIDDYLRGEKYIES
jgi:hypothetical protein